MNDLVKKTIGWKGAERFSLPILGLGTYGMGGFDDYNPNNDDKQDIKSIQKAIELGFTHIDTAESYAEGYAEILIGKAIKNFEHKKLFITTKVRRSNLGYSDVIKSAKKSISRLGIKTIDLYLIHAPNKEIALRETLRGMDYLLENELIKNIGVCNFDIPLLEEAMSQTKYSIVNNQIHYSLAARAYKENKTLEFCRKNNILSTAYRTFGYNQFNDEAKRILEKLSEKYKKTPVQIAINWVINKPNIVSLIKSSNLKHLKENFGALGWKLESEDEKNLNTRFPKGVTINIADKI